MACGIGNEKMTAENEAKNTILISLLRKKHLHKTLANKREAADLTENAEN